MTTADHITAANRALDFDEETHPNPTFRAAIAQAHALTAIAMLLQRMADQIEADNEPEMFRSVRIFGNEIAH